MATGNMVRLLMATGVLLIIANVVHSTPVHVPGWDCHKIKCPVQLSCDRRDQVQNGGTCCPTCGGTLGQYCDTITFCTPDLVCTRINHRSVGEGICISRSTETRLSQFPSSHKRYLSDEFENYNKDATTAYSNPTTDKNYEDKHGDHQGYTRETTTASADELEQRHHDEGHGYGEVPTPTYTEGYMDKRHHSEGHDADEHDSSVSDEAALIKLLMKLLKSDSSK